MIIKLGKNCSVLGCCQNWRQLQMLAVCVCDSFWVFLPSLYDNFETSWVDSMLSTFLFFVWFFYWSTLRFVVCLPQNSMKTSQWCSRFTRTHTHTNTHRKRDRLLMSNYCHNYANQINTRNGRKHLKSWRDTDEFRTKQTLHKASMKPRDRLKDRRREW